MSNLPFPRNMWGAAPRPGRILPISLLAFALTALGHSALAAEATVAAPTKPHVWGVEVDGSDVTWITGATGRVLRAGGINELVADRSRVSRAGLTRLRTAAQ